MNRVKNHSSKRGERFSTKQLMTFLDVDTETERKDKLLDSSNDLDSKFKYYYGAYNHNVHYRPFMEFELKDMKHIVGDDGKFTDLVTKKSEWERITEFILSADRTRFDFYLTLLHLGL